MDPIESARRRGIELAKVQIFTRIKAQREIVDAIIWELRNDPDLISLENDSSKLASFKLRGDPGSTLQVSSTGAVTLTIASPSSGWKLYMALLAAMWSCRLTPVDLKPLRARIYRVEEYPVRSFDEVISLICAQTILGARGRRRDQEED